MRYVLEVAGNWFYEANFLKISSAMHSGRKCLCYVRKIPGFYDWLLEHCFLAANAGLWMGTYQLQEIAWNLDLSRVEVEWNLPCHRTSCWFFFSKSVPFPESPPPPPPTHTHTHTTKQEKYFFNISVHTLWSIEPNKKSIEGIMSYFALSEGSFYHFIIMTRLNQNWT